MTGLNSHKYRNCLQVVTSFNVRVRIGDAVQTVRVESAKDSVDKTIEDAFKKFKLRKMVEDDKEASDFIFKVTGFEEYLYGEHLTIEYDCIRSLLKKQQEVPKYFFHILLCSFKSTRLTYNLNSKLG
jgi:hypothetical protein